MIEKIEKTVDGAYRYAALAAKLLGLAGLALIVLVVIAYARKEPAPRAQFAPSATVENANRAEVGDLVAAYNASVPDAHLRFGDQWVHVTGVVDEFGKDGDYDPFVRLASEAGAPRTGTFKRVQCSFPRTFSAELAKFKPGQKVRVTGYCWQALSDLVWVKNCRSIELLK